MQFNFEDIRIVDTSYFRVVGWLEGPSSTASGITTQTRTPIQARCIVGASTRGLNVVHVHGRVDRTTNA